MSEPLSLFHGTTLHAAEQIRAEGWQARDLTGIVGELATQHGVPEVDVFDDLRRYNRFVLIEESRGQVASFAPTYDKAAGSWAQRAPEAEWEALWAIWRIKYSGETELYHWNQDVPGNAWVLGQMAAQKLAVVEVRLTVDEAIELGALVGGFRHAPLTPEHVPILRHLPEVAFPLPFQPEFEVVVHQVERRVRWDVFAYWLGMTQEEFIAHDKAGSFGPAGGSDFEIGPWWPLSAVDALRERVDAGLAFD